ncbi:protein phosphatase 2C domain-containing protein [Bacillus sp. 31A1R]|uniref:Protein phosphatase 2C domain-containing protein n=1 Tax=Robertmurraya mangrovi TaxID=3098077 RepID=A0ABU5J123_9BACI|nr:protein phosphatase 2C domain-containing protein [Bacillus sp. 31A1R]MDZ5473099.1 protein phosphatase 2C domain-containing protein [Bacillus sp. 31A1R]
MNKTYSNEYSWVGSQKAYLDEINIFTVEHVVLGRFGGNSSAGQTKNEDGCIIWVDRERNYEFVVLLDAHQTAESAELVVATLEQHKKELTALLSLQVSESLTQLNQFILSIFQNKEFKEKCRNVQGETACLIVLRKEQFLWWFSIGDCPLYLHHSELAFLQEFQLNQRSFYQWVGRVNTFELPVPCYSTGTKELRQGTNHIFLTTDGLVECPNTNFTNHKEIFHPFQNQSNEESVSWLLNEIKVKNVRDSTTVISWFVENELAASQPSV